MLGLAVCCRAEGFYAVAGGCMLGCRVEVVGVRGGELGPAGSGHVDDEAAARAKRT